MQHERPEDQPLVDADVARQVGARVALPQVPQRLPRAADEACVRGERDRDVEVEDPLREALVGVVRRDEEDERECRRDEHERAHRERGQGDAAQATHGRDCRSRRVTRRRHTRTTPSRPPRREGRRARETRGSGPGEPTTLAPTAPTTIGMASGRKSSGSSRSRARVATAIAPRNVPTPQIPRSARRTAATVAPPTRWKKSA